MGKHKHSPPGPIPDPASFGLPLSGVETHAHLDDRRFNMDREETLARARAAGLARIGQVFLGSAAWAAGRELFSAHPEVFFLLGVHPTEAGRLTDKELAALRAAALQDRRIKAIGETGLDYYWKDTPAPAQQEAFRRQLRLARDLDLPIVIHCREAEEDTLKILLEEGCARYPLLWHCFGKDKRLALRLVELGWHISIPGPVTFPANAALREAVAAIPEERLLMETDCPYMAPQPCRGRRNEPAYLVFSIQAMAQARGVSPQDLWSSCGRAAAAFFRLEPLPGA